MSEFLERLTSIADAAPDAVAVVRPRGRDADDVATYGQLVALVGELSAAFDRLLGRAPFVPILANKSVISLAAVVAALATGRVFVSLNRRLKPLQIREILEACRCQYLFADDETLGVAHAQLSATMPDVVHLPLERILQAEVPDLRGGGGDILLPKSMAQGGVCLFTSGSTGSPKGVLVESRDLLERALVERDWFGLRFGEALLSVLPLSFDVGLNQFLSSMITGCSLVVCDSWLPGDLLRAVERYRVAGISGVPAIWQDMLRAEGGFDVTGRHASLRYITVSGGDLPRPQLERLAQAAGVGVFKTYGQSEAFRATSLRPEEFAERMSSVGRAFPGVHVYVVREDNSCCAPGEEGEIVHTGLGVMAGYLGDRGTDGKLRPNPFQGADDPHEWAIFTGDFGYLDAEGYLFVRGRNDDMLKIHGNRVYPSEVACHLAALPEVSDVCILGETREPEGTVLVAYVVPRAGTAPTGEALRRALAVNVAGYMVPREVHIVEQIPRTYHGKPDRAKLRALAAGMREAAAASRRAQV